MGMWDDIAAVKSALELLLDQWDELGDSDRRRLIGLAVSSADGLVETVQRYDSVVVELDLEADDHVTE